MPFPGRIERSHWVVLRVGRSALSPGVWDGRPPRSAASWPVTLTLEAGTGQRLRIRWPRNRRADPKQTKLVTNLILRARVELDLEMKYSPEQIAGRLRGDHPGDPQMWASTETIDQSTGVSWRRSPRNATAPDPAW